MTYNCFFYRIPFLAKHAFLFNFRCLKSKTMKRKLEKQEKSTFSREPKLQKTERSKPINLRRSTIALPYRFDEFFFGTLSHASFVTHFTPSDCIFHKNSEWIWIKKMIQINGINLITLAFFARFRHFECSSKEQ